MFSAREIFDIAIRLEQNGEQLYREALIHMTDESLKEMIEWLADQEKHHQDLFLDMRRSVKPGSNDGWAETLGRAILDGTLEHHAFSLEEVDFKSIKSEAELIKTALEFEHDGVLFYQILGTFLTDEEALGQLRGIIDEEKGHIRSLEERRSAIEKLEGHS